MRNELKIVGDIIIRRACVFNFLPLFTSHCFLAGLSERKKKSLCDLCDSSEAGGESMSKQ
jgi:hypothetical protein